MGKNIGKYISINLSGKYTRDILDYAKQSATNAFKTFSKKKKKKKKKREIKKTNSEIVQNEYDHEKPKERLYLQKKDRKLLKIWD